MANFTMPVFLYGNRKWMFDLPPDRQEEEARRAVRMLVLPRRPGAPMADGDVPEALVTTAMVERYLQLEPPIATMNQEFQDIIKEIEYTFVHGVFFSTVSASCVTIERVLNKARMELHHHCPKIKGLWGKGPTNEWYPNINALEQWGYVDLEFAVELRMTYQEIRNRYLHSGDIKDLQADAFTSASVAYRLLGLLVGFPPDLFTFVNGRMACKNENDPRYLALYRPHMTPTT